jgi:hypothetical protein
MGLIAPLASLLGIETGALIQKVRESAVAYAAIGLFALIGVVFLLVAAYTGLADWVGPIWSPLILAAAALIVAIVLVIALRIKTAEAERRAEHHHHEAEASALVATAALAALPEILASPLVRSVGLPIGLYLGALLLTRNRSGSAAPRPRRSRPLT